MSSTSEFSSSLLQVQTLPQRRCVSFEMSNHSYHSVDSVNSTSASSTASSAPASSSSVSSVSTTTKDDDGDDESHCETIHCEIYTIPPLCHLLTEEEKSNLWYTKYELDQLRRNELEQQKQQFLETNINVVNKVSAIKQRLQQRRNKRRIIVAALHSTNTTKIKL